VTSIIIFTDKLRCILKDLFIKEQWFFSASRCQKKRTNFLLCKKDKGSPDSIAESRVPELILVLGSQPAGNMSHKPSCWLSVLSAKPEVTPATLKKAATNFGVWQTEAQLV